MTYCFSFDFQRNKEANQNNMVVGEIIERIRNTSRSRSRGRSSSNSCMCIEYSGSFKLLVLGDQGVGKTTICSKYTSQEDTSSTNQDTGEVFSTCVYISGGGAKGDRAKQYDLEISVANGVYWQGTVDGYKSKIQESQGYILVYSKENRQSYMKLVEILSDIHKLKKSHDLPVIIVGNKCDLNEIKTLQIQDSEHVVLGDLAHFDVSALENNGLQEAFKCLSQMCAQQYDKSNNKLTDKIVE